ncbi:hypothetical protein ACN08Z_07475 [Rothia sp. P7181]|uniref:hypothetical protein n=1 Tax=unclassified Rothia (in: high G+C Gram-positive bacteria) TaxID=2689056 RepID=UPI003ACAEFA2
MTEHNAEEQKDSLEDSYLYESFVTEDGIEVPPPTRPMGPRRLARYRIDAAAYLRALRDGTELPEETVAYMPVAHVGSGEASISDEALSVQQRFSALAEQGDIHSHDDLSGEQFTGENDTRADVGVIATALGEEVSSLPSDGEQAEAPDVPAHAVSASDYSFAEDELVSAEEFEESEAVDTAEAEADNSSVSETPIETASENEREEQPEEQSLPKPVAAVDAHGLDLESCGYHVPEETLADTEEETLPAEQAVDSTAAIPWEGSLTSATEEDATAEASSTTENTVAPQDTVESTGETSFGALPVVAKDTSFESVNFADDVASIAQKTAKSQDSVADSSAMTQETMSIREQLAASSAKYNNDSSSLVNAEEYENTDYSALSASENTENEVESSSKVWLFILLALVLAAVIAVWFVFFQ